MKEQICGWDVRDWDHAVELAEQKTTATGRKHIPTDAGGYVSPRVNVSEVPTIGAKVSRGFNGDYYPAGKIVAISATLKKITTDTGVVFWRRRLTGAWVSQRAWSMVAGHVNERNPSF